MSTYPFFLTNLKSLTICLSFGFFLIYLFWIILFKTAAQENSYVETSKIHFIIGLFYLFTTITVASFNNKLNTDFLISLITGIYIYTSLHYLFIFQLIGLCKKSISIAMLNTILQANKSGKEVTEKYLKKLMKNKNISIEDIRESRINQMCQLKFAKHTQSQYQITFFGKTICKLREILLKLSNLKGL